MTDTTPTAIRAALPDYPGLTDAVCEEASAYINSAWGNAPASANERQRDHVVAAYARATFRPLAAFATAERAEAA